MQNLDDTFLLIFFISDFIRDEKICILLSTYFSTLMRSDMILTSDFNFPFVTSTPFSMCFAVDVETTHCKRILSFFALLNLMNETIKFFGLFLFIFFEDRRLITVNAARFGLLLFPNKEIYEYVNICYQKRAPFFKNKRLFLPSLWMKLAGLKTTDLFAIYSIIYKHQEPTLTFWQKLSST